MFKKNRGVTLISLIITIMVISILAATIFITSVSLIKDTKIKTVASNMYLVKGKAETIYDEYNFSEDESVLVGEKYTEDVLKYGANISNNDLWYKWNSNTLSSVGLDSDMLPRSAKFIVNYTTGEVIYTPGCEDENGDIVYTLSEMTK